MGLSLEVFERMKWEQERVDGLGRTIGIEKSRGIWRDRWVEEIWLLYFGREICAEANGSKPGINL